MEWEDSLETNSVREQSPERHRNEVRSTESRDVRGGYLCREIQGIPGQWTIQVASRQQSTELAENVLNGPKLHWEVDSSPGRIQHDN